MTRHTGYALLLLWWLTCTVAAASEQSTRLYSRGLVLFHAEQYTEALALFDKAVAADADDIHARYYRAVTRGRLHDLDGAIADLRTVLTTEPNFDQAALELGVALVQTGSLREALPWLGQAQRAPDTDAQASLFLGLAQLRLGRLVEARQNFQRGAKDPQQSLAAEYYEGVVDYREGHAAEAEKHFLIVIRNSPDSEVKNEAQLFVKALHEPVREAYQLYGTAGFQYDTNVVLAPSSDVIKQAAGISRQSDGRFTLNAGGTYALWRREQTQLSVGYDFFQSLHFRLTEFNLQDHGPNVQLVSAYGPFQFGLLGRYDYYLLGTNSFLQEGSALPWITVVGDRGRMEVFYRMRRRDFIQRSYWVRDAFNHSTGVRQFFYLDSPDHYVCLGYRFDREDPIDARPSLNADQFAYDGHEVNGGVGWTFPAAFTAEATYAYRHENYARPSNGRHDDQHQFAVVLRKELDARLALVTGYFGTINNSTNEFGDKRFDYERHIGSVALEARF
jgi:tetratricopeptide (TPR) repeat protein